jgi:anti-anti-sigma factor
VILSSYDFFVNKEKGRFFLMDIHIEQKDAYVIVTAAGKIDAVTCTELEAKLNNLADNGQNRILINFKEVSYISSAGLRVLLAITKKLHGKGSLSLCSLSKGVRDIVTMAGFDHFMAIHDDLETAESVIINRG